MTVIVQDESGPMPTSRAAPGIWVQDVPDGLRRVEAVDALLNVVGRVV